MVALLVLATVMVALAVGHSHGGHGQPAHGLVEVK